MSSSPLILDIYPHFLTSSMENDYFKWSLWPVHMYLYFICETVELKSLRSHFHVNFIVFQTSDSWCQSTLMSFVNNFQLKIFQNNNFKTSAFSNNKCWAKLQDDLVVTSEMRFVVYSAVCGLIWAIYKLLYSEDPVCNDTRSWRKLQLTK